MAAPNLKSVKAKKEFERIKELNSQADQHTTANPSSPSLKKIMELEAVEKAGLAAGRPSMSQQQSMIPSYTAVEASGTSLKITIDFASEERINNTSFESKDYRSFRRSLLETIAAASDATTEVVLSFYFPRWSSQTIDTRKCQRELSRRIAEIFNQKEGLKKFRIILKSPDTSWEQVQCLVPFYSMWFQDWTACIKEGDTKSEDVTIGSGWDRRLKGHFRHLKDRNVL